MATPKKRGGLGGSLLGQGRGSNVEAVLQALTTPTVGGMSGVPDIPGREVDPQSIRPSPYQPRQDFDPAKLEELADSIRAQGLLQPLVVRETPAGLELMAGERRLRAAKLAGLSAVPVVVRNVDDATAAGIALAENLAREDLTAWETAQGLARLRDVLADAGASPTVRQLARVAGRSAGGVSEALQVADRLTSDVQALAALDVRSLNALPHTSLIGAAKGESPEDRARLLRLAVGSEAPGRAVQQERASKPKRGRPPRPYVLQARKDGRLSFSIKRPGEIDGGTAREILERLEPVLQALRERAEEE